MPSRELAVWTPPLERPEFLAEQKRKADLAAAKSAELAARIAQAERRRRQADIHEVSEKLVLTQLQKLLRLAAHPDFANSTGPIEMKDLIKLAELASKDFRLDTGQATANVAHAIGPSIDFSKMSQEERDQYRALVVKGGGDVE